jgi:hypothetical protein
MDKMNGREELEAASQWLAYQDEDLSFCLTAEEGLKLWRYAQAHPELAEFCDRETGEEGDWRPKNFKAAIGRSNPYLPSRAFNRGGVSA